MYNNPNFNRAREMLRDMIGNLEGDYRLAAVSDDDFTVAFSVKRRFLPPTKIVSFDEISQPSTVSSYVDVEIEREVRFSFRASVAECNSHLRCYVEQELMRVYLEKVKHLL